MRAWGVGRVRRFGNTKSKFSYITDCGSTVIIHQLHGSSNGYVPGFLLHFYASQSPARATRAPQSMLDSQRQFQCVLEIEWSLDLEINKQPKEGMTL